MVELGQWLRSAREAKGLSLAQVEDAIRIRQKYLAALESGEWSEMPGDVAARGFLRNYSTFLGLDENETLARLGRPARETAEIVANAEALLGPRAVDYRPIELDLVEETPLNVRWVTIGLLVGALVIVLAAGILFTRNNPNWLAGLARAASTSTLTPSATPAIVSGVVEPTRTPVPTATPTAEPFRITATPTSSIFTLPTPTPTATPVSTAQPAPTATSLPSQIEVTADVSQRAWIRVTADGEIVFEKILEAGSAQSWTATQTMILRTGNAGGVSVSVNGNAQGTMGDLGAIEECTWTLEAGVVSGDCTGNPASAPTATPGATT